METWPIQVVSLNKETNKIYGSLKSKITVISIYGIILSVEGRDAGRGEHQLTQLNPTHTFELGWVGFHFFNPPIRAYIIIIILKIF